MEEVVERMRNDIDITLQSDNTFRVGFVGGDAPEVMKVTQRLVSLLIQENVQDRALLAEQTDEFIKSQLEDLRTRLIRQKQQLNAARQSGSPQAETMAIEYDVLQATFKDLLTKLEESRMSANLERRQIGEQFKLVDAPRVAEGPFSPDRRIYAGVGAAAGLAAGLLLSFAIRWTRLRGGRNNKRLPLRPESQSGASFGASPRRSRSEWQGSTFEEKLSAGRERARSRRRDDNSRTNVRPLTVRAMASSGTQSDRPAPAASTAPRDPAA